MHYYLNGCVTFETADAPFDQKGVVYRNSPPASFRLRINNLNFVV